MWTHLGYISGFPLIMKSLVEREGSVLDRVEFTTVF